MKFRAIYTGPGIKIMTPYYDFVAITAQALHCAYDAINFAMMGEYHVSEKDVRMLSAILDIIEDWEDWHEKNKGKSQCRL